MNDSGNIFIEGENLEVLKIIQKSYAGRIKMIYIDPPYNTGNDFIYDDNFSESLQEYLSRTSQLDEGGKPLTTNRKADGRFHSKWLSMMYPRLLIARSLLVDDGIIFISIDDNEVNYLRSIMNEIFGEENFQQEIIWKNKYGPGALTKGFGNLHEYILCYSKNPIESISSNLNIDEIGKYKLKDDNYSIRGGYITQPLATKSKDDRPNLVYPIPYNGIEIWPDKQWIWSKERMFQAIENGEVVIKENNGSYSVRFKQYLKDESGVIRKGKPLSIMIGPYNQDGTKEIYNLFGSNVFDFPKPTELIKLLFSTIINENEDKNGIYLDFFSGSASAAHALLKLNSEDNGNREMISIQIPFIIEDDKPARKLGYNVITDISKDRLRKLANLPPYNGLNDKGFKSFKLSKSHFKKWENYSGNKLNSLLDLYSEFEDPFITGYSKTGLLIEIMLLEGFPLNSSINKLSNINDNEVYIISSHYIENQLLVCLDKKIAFSTLEQINLDINDLLVCLDIAISDQDKLRLNDKGMIKTIGSILNFGC